MNILSLISLTILGIFVWMVCVQASLVRRYLGILQTYAWGNRLPAPLPDLKATIVLCLRGSDPFLTDCIRALLHQNYPDYSVQIIVDSVTDPAWSIAQTTVRQFGSTVPVKIHPLQSPRSTCSLKCSALLQAVDELDADCEVVALIDADTIAHPDWLKELVVPLLDQQVGIVTGGRWYTATGQQWGTIYRYIWNAFSLMSMYYHRIPWGGTLAFRTELLADVMEPWSKSLCEDVPLRQAALNRGLTIQFNPALIIINQEETSFSGFLKWAARQTLLVRLYHPDWSQISFDVLFSPILAIGAAGLWALMLVQQQWQAATYLGIGLTCFYVLGSVIPLIWIDWTVRQVAIARREHIRSISPLTVVQISVAMLSSYLTAIVIALAALSANCVKWRGINYAIHSAEDIHLKEYFPYSQGEQTFSASTKASL